MTALDPRPHDWLRRALAVLGWGVLGAVGVTGAAMAAQLVATDDRLLVHEVRFTGNHQVSAQALRHLADVRNGEHLFLVDLGRAVDGIERHPAIASASARRVFPGVVQIDVVEHEPKMLLALDELWFLDAEGRPYARAGSAALDLPVITGLDGSFVDGDPEHARAVVWGARRVLGSAVADAGIAEADVSEIHFDRLHGFELVLRSGTRLVVGYGNPSLPLQRVPALAKAGLDLRTPQLVDLDSERVAVATPLDSGRPMLGGTR